MNTDKDIADKKSTGEQAQREQMETDAKEKKTTEEASK